ncbi:MAG: helix-turn-helix transcriptional regulator [Clostridiales bacterium]|nr:helix-turn-helix transcriptional regulator [Clostridiales bacterium]
MRNLNNKFDPIKSDFIRKIKYLRKERGLNQQQVANELSVTQATVSKLENGQIEPSINILRKIAMFFNVSCDYLLGISPDKSGRSLSKGNDGHIVGENGVSHTINEYGNIASKQQQKIIHKSLEMIYEIIDRCDIDALHMNASMILMLNIYKIFRALYNVNPYNIDEFYKINSTIYEDLVDSEIAGRQAVVKSLLNKNSRELKEKLEMSGERLIKLDEDAYFYLSNLISQCENIMMAGHNYNL